MGAGGHGGFSRHFDAESGECAHPPLSGTLPSRAADNLFWLGRYLERAEETLRVVRALVGRLSEVEPAAGPLVTRLLSLLSGWGAMPRDLARANPGRYALAALTRADLPGLCRSWCAMPAPPLP